MHTALCAFDTPEAAERAVAALVRAGFARHDVHIEHKSSGADGRPHTGNDRWDGMEREVAVDRGVLSSFGAFFASIFGSDHTPGHLDTYTQHVVRGNHVVVVDASSDEEARRASTLLHEMQGTDVNVTQRSDVRPLRDIVGERQATGGSADTYDAAGSFGQVRTGMQSERAVASNAVSPTTGPSLRDPDLEHAPGLRYADKDKPL